MWEQIETFIADEAESDAWLLVATNNSLASQKCKEEFAYALDRALQSRGATFPVTALFLGPVDESLVPAGIRTRLFVTSADPDWKERILAAAEGRNPHIVPVEVQPFVLKVHEPAGPEKRFAIEVRPRGGGVWAPFFAAVPAAERERVNPMMMVGPSDVPTCGGMLVNAGQGRSDDGKWWTMVASNQANPTTSYYVWCDRLPSELVFGVNGRAPQYRVPLQGARGDGGVRPASVLLQSELDKASTAVSI